MNTISKEEARQIMLSAQGLAQPNTFGKNIGGTANTIRHLGYVQLDTLSVVTRAHHHILWTRNSSYNEEHLHQLLARGKVFEYWSHAASYLPMEDFRFTLPRKARYVAGHSHWFSKNKKLMKFVLDRIKAEGPLQSKDFETDRKRSTWFDWKPAKIALEQLFMEGSLMVRERKGFQKVYDLTERVVPSAINHEQPSQEEYAEYFVEFNLRSLGIAALSDFTHLMTELKDSISKAVKRLLTSGKIQEVKIERVTEIYFMKSNSRKKNSKPVRGVHILSPFDNLIIRRPRLKSIFDWSYNLECYLPEHKRKFGYFCLPILHDGKFVGMFDPKADRNTGEFHIKKMYLDKSAMNSDFINAFHSRLNEFSMFNGCDQIKIDRTVSPVIRKLLLQK